MPNSICYPPRKKCSVKICDGMAYSLNAKYCAAHKRRLIKFGSLKVRTPIKRRIWGSRLTQSPGYKCWISMNERCNNPENKNYKYYGARGIKVCKRWRSSENFLKDMGPPFKGASLERKNNDRGYSPSNCKWATGLEQIRNRRNTIKASLIRDIERLLGLGASQAIIAEMLDTYPGLVSIVKCKAHWRQNV